MVFADADLKNPTLAGDMPSFNSKEQSDDVRGTNLPPRLFHRLNADVLSQSLDTIL